MFRHKTPRALIFRRLTASITVLLVCSAGLADTVTQLGSKAPYSIQ